MRNAANIFLRIEESKRRFLQQYGFAPTAVLLDTNDYLDLESPRRIQGLEVIELGATEVHSCTVVLK